MTKTHDSTSQQSIYEFVAERARADGSIDHTLGLPDADPTTPGGIRWGPGSLDGVISHHVKLTGQSEGSPERLFAAVQAAAAEVDGSSDSVVVEALGDATLAGTIDELLRRLREEGANLEAIHRLACRIVERGTHRELVKLGIALLGFSGLGEARHMVVTLGAHPEFTLFSAVALSHSDEDSERALWALAKVAPGWGRIQCVERLEGTNDAEIQEWLLREGFRNSVMNEYLAFIAADTGGLYEALARDDLDASLLKGASEIMMALFIGGPARDLKDFQDPLALVVRYVDAMDRGAASVFDFEALLSARRDLRHKLDPVGEARKSAASLPQFILDANPNAAQEMIARAQEAGSDADPAVVRELLERIAAILARPGWRDTVVAALASADTYEANLALGAARELDIDTFPTLLARMRNGLDAYAWQVAWGGADDARARQILDLARELLDYDRLGAGAATEVGLGSQWAESRVFETLLPPLERFPDLGDQELLVACASPVVRTRNQAARVIRVRGRATAEQRAALETMVGSDPDDSVRENAAETLAALDAT